MSEFSFFNKKLLGHLDGQRSLQTKFKRAVGSVYVKLTDQHDRETELADRLREKAKFPKTIVVTTALNDLAQGKGSLKNAIGFYFLAKIDPLYADCVAPIEEVLFRGQHSFDSVFGWKPRVIFDPSPFYNSYASQAAQIVNQVDRRIKALRGSFYGRSDQLSDLDKFVETNTNGLAIVTGPAGSGKSAFLAEWLAEREYVAKGQVAYHFFSNLTSRTTSQTGCETSLLEQIAPRLRNARGAVPPRPSTLFEALEIGPGRSRKLIIVVDGIDEADPDEKRRSLAPFFDPKTLGPNVFVVVSARLETDKENPSYLREWLRLGQKGIPFRQIGLPGLRDGEVSKWLRDQIRNLSVDEEAAMAKALHTTTSGYPLYLSYVIEDLAEAFKGVTDPRARLDQVLALPKTFLEYIAYQIELIASELGDDPWITRVRPLLATLSVLWGPISRDDLEHFFGASAPSFEALAYCVSRWLLVSSGRYSYAHPRLAETFATVLGTAIDDAQDSTATRSPYVARQERHLIEWMQQNWKADVEAGLDSDGREYALDWLPEHLAYSGAEGQLQAAQLIANPTFLKERVRTSSENLSARIARHFDLWGDLSVNLLGEERTAQWSRFCADNEANLRLIASAWNDEAQALAQAVEALTADIHLLSGNEAFQSRARNSRRLRPHRLIRSIENAHTILITRATPFADGLMTRGRDGAVKFWNQNGREDPTRRLDFGEKGWLNDIQPFENGWICKFDDGVFRFLDAQGNLDRTREIRAGSSWVTDYLVQDDKLITANYEGEVSIWSLQTGAQTKRIERAHPARWPIKFASQSFGAATVNRKTIRFWDRSWNVIQAWDVTNHASENVLAFGSWYVTWTREGGVYFWDETGHPNYTRGNQRFHKEDVYGGVVSGNRLVTWGKDGEALLWDENGYLVRICENPFPKEAISKVVAFGDGFVRVGFGLPIIFWDSNGNMVSSEFDGCPLVGGIKHYNCHGDKIAIWDYEDNLGVWNTKGRYLENYSISNSNTHLNGGLALGDRLLTWGEDCRLRFWHAGADSHKLETDDFNLDTVKGITKTTGGYFIWGQEPHLRFYDEAGDREPSRDILGAHDARVNCVMQLDGTLVSGAADGAVRWWSPSGQMLAEQQHGSNILGMAASGDKVITTDAGTVKVWGEDGTGADFPFFDFKNARYCRNMIWTGRGLAAWSWKTVRFWDVEGELISSNYQKSFWVRKLAKCGDAVAGVNQTGFMWFWDDKGYPLDSSAFDQESEDVPQFEYLPHCGLTQFNGRIVSWGQRDGWVKYRDSSGRVDRFVENEAEHGGWIVKCLPWRSSLAVVYSTGLVRVWNENLELSEQLIVPGGVRIAEIINHQLVVFGRQIWEYELRPN